MSNIRAAVLAVCVIACKQGDQANKQEPQKQPEPAGSAAATGSAAPTGSATAPQPTATASEAPRKLDAPPPAKLLDAPVERRLYSDRVESSSFLWTNWNKFQENYHPNYILDGDPATAWVEGADNSGAGEWVRIHISPVEGASKIRLKIQNGYHKSKELHKKNARLAKVELVALPSGTKHTAALTDTMGWQEVAFEQPAGKLEAIELRAVEVVEGSKYTDLCVSDVELYVTGLTVENPAFEKSKLASLLAWKKKRLEAAKVLSSDAAKELPILAGYRVTEGEKMSFETPRDGKAYPELRGTLAALGKLLTSPAHAEATKRATAALEADFAGWVTVQTSTKEPIALPEVDGLSAADEPEEMLFSPPDDTFLLPDSSQGVLVRSSHLTTFDMKSLRPLDRDKCKPGTSEFMRGPKQPDDGPIVRELVHVRCIEEETREGKITYVAWELLEFDAEGNLVLVAGPNDRVQWLEWQKQEQRTVLMGGGRLDGSGNLLARLTPTPAVATK